MERLEEMDRAEQVQAETQEGLPGKAVELDDGKAGEEVVPVVPEEPEPGVPAEPDVVVVDASGSEMVGVPADASMGSGLEGPGSAEEPQPGIPEEPVPGIPEEPDPAVPDSPQPEGIQDTGRTTGLPEDPEPGIPEEPSPAPPGTPGGAERDGEKNEVSGPHITLAGRVNMDASLEAKIRIDIFDGDHRNLNAPRPKVVQFHELQRAGPFELSVPQNAKRVWIGAYADLNANNRPDRGEPRGWYARNPVFLANATETILIELVQEKVADDLGADFGG